MFVLSFLFFLFVGRYELALLSLFFHYIMAE